MQYYSLRSEEVKKEQVRIIKAFSEKTMSLPIEKPLEALTKKEIIKAIKLKAEKMEPNVLTSRVLLGLTPSCPMIVKKLGVNTWSAVLKMAGMETREWTKNGDFDKCTPDEMIKILQKWKKDLPEGNRLAAANLPPGLTLHIVKKILGVASWEEACVKAGLIPKVKKLKHKPKS